MGISDGVLILYAAILTKTKSPGINVFAIDEVGILYAPIKNALINIPRRRRISRTLIIFFKRLILQLNHNFQKCSFNITNITEV